MFILNKMFQSYLCNGSDTTMMHVPVMGLQPAKIISLGSISAMFFSV